MRLDGVGGRAGVIECQMLSGIPSDVFWGARSASDLVFLKSQGKKVFEDFVVERVSLGSPGTSSIEEAGLKFTDTCLPQLFKGWS